ncbi:MAG: 6-carboxytetrahydropterin synthase QueD [Nitrososphaerales archaeon]
MYSLTVSGTFAAAHYLTHYPGACSRLHGHTWKVEVTVVASEKNPDTGMVEDFATIKSNLREVLSDLDHRCVNDVLNISEATAEYVAEFIYTKLSQMVFTAKLDSVTVWESDNARVTYSPWR